MCHRDLLISAVNQAVRFGKTLNMANVFGLKFYRCSIWKFYQCILRMSRYSAVFIYRFQYHVEPLV